MPELDRFDGIAIHMYYEVDSKHHLPHLHVDYNEFDAVYDFNGVLIEGELPANKARKVKKWIENNQENLLTSWNSFTHENQGSGENEN